MKLEDVILRDDRSSQPAANTVAVGTIYYVTDENVTERSDGASWEDISDVSGGGTPGGSSGDIQYNNAGSFGGITPGTGVVTFLQTPSSANLASAVTGETGSGALVFGTSPTLTTPALGTPSALVLTNATGLPLSTGVTGTLPTANFITAAKTRAITLGIDGGGSAITTGIKADVYVPYACTITAVTMLADQSGSIVVDIWKDSYANYPPTDADSITASAVPTITTAVKSQDATLTGWTTSVSAGDTLRFNVDSITTITRLSLILTVTV